MKNIIINEDDSNIIQIDDKENLKLDKRLKKRDYIKYFIIIIIIIIYWYYFHNFYQYFGKLKLYSQYYIYKLYYFLLDLYKKNWIIFLIFVTIFQILIIGLMLPMHLVYSLIIYFIVKTPIYVFLIIYITTLIGTSIVYYLTNFIFKEYIFNKIKNNSLIKPIKNKIKDNPYKYTILCKFLTLPLGLKEYILSLFCNFLPFTVGSLLYYLSETFQAVLIGNELSSLSDFLKGNSNHSIFLQSFLTLILIVSFIFSLFIAKYIWKIINLEKNILKI